MHTNETHTHVVGSTSTTSVIDRRLQHQRKGTAHCLANAMWQHSWCTGNARKSHRQMASKCNNSPLSRQTPIMHSTTKTLPFKDHLHTSSSCSAAIYRPCALASTGASSTSACATTVLATSNLDAGHTLQCRYGASTVVQCRQLRLQHKCGAEDAVQGCSCGAETELLGCACGAASLQACG